jgi:hypothetical protein
MPGFVYLLSAATGLACSYLLWRSWRTSSVRLLLWSALCFLGLTLDNVLLYLDLVLFPDVHMYDAPMIVGLVSISILLFGLIWDGT